MNTKPKRWILVRGLVRSRKHWNSFPENLESVLGAKVDCVELPGNGFLSSEITPARIGDAIQSLRGQCKGESPFGLLGISLGGMLSVKWAQLFPNEVSHLILINTSSSLSPFYHRLRPKNYAGIVKILLAGNPSAIEEFILSVSSNDEKKWRPLLEANTRFQTEHPIRNGNFLRQLQLTAQVDFLEQPTCKKLILASENDQLVSPACSKLIAQEWQVPIKLHPTAGHDLPLDDENWVIDQIRTFIMDSTVATGE